MSQQVKLPKDVKREVEVFAAVTGRNQGQLLAEAWREYRERHGSELSAGLQWAQETLKSSAATSVEASGMPDADLDELRDAFES